MAALCEQLTESVADYKILIVEDDVGLQNLIEKKLVKNNYNVIRSSSAQQALDCIASEKPDALLLDQRLPDMNGNELISQIKHQHGEIPFIVMTGQGNETLAVEMMKLGAGDYLLKDVELLDHLPGAFHRLFREEEVNRRLRRAEKSLRESEARYKSIISLSNTGAWEFHHTNGSIWCSPEYYTMLGYDPVEFSNEGMSVLQRAWINLLHPDERDSVVSLFKQYLDSGAHGMYENYYRMRRKDGTWAWVWSRGQTLRSEDGACGDVTLGIHIDITERKRLEDNLKQAEKMEAVGQLAGGVAHDFNNQLGGILGYTELLQTKVKGKDENECLKQIVNAAKRAADLTSQLLSFARKGNNIASDIDIHKILQESISILKRSIDKRIEIVEKFDAVYSIVNVDITQLQNAFLNLAINARDAMPDGGVMTFSTKILNVNGNGPDPELADGKYIEVCIKDNGTGIPPEIQQHIFEPFFTTKEQGKGTGLGLASVFGTIKSNHGAILCTSEMGKGSAFYSYLPLSANQSPDQLQQDTTESSSKKLSSRVLVVDDESTMINVITQTLESTGCSVVSFTSPEEALTCFRSDTDNFDLIIMDIVMPQTNGKDLFKIIHGINPRIPILFSSGYAFNDEIRELVNLGAAGFIHKPFHLKDFITEVNKALHNAN